MDPEPNRTAGLAVLTLRDASQHSGLASGILEIVLVPVFLLLATAVGSSAAKTGTAPSDHERRLRLYHTHTGQRIDVVYRRDGTYIPEALSQLDEFLRDHRTREVHHFNPRLFDLLSDLANAVDRPAAEIDVICGYRTPWSNEFLRRRRSSGVAKHSLHMQAEAIDIRLHGTRTADVRRAALALQRGGVGYYPHSDFVHVDVGRPRRW